MKPAYNAVKCLHNTKDAHQWHVYYRCLLRIVILLYDLLTFVMAMWCLQHKCLFKSRYKGALLYYDAYAPWNGMLHRWRKFCQFGNLGYFCFSVGCGFMVGSQPSASAWPKSISIVLRFPAAVSGRIMTPPCGRFQPPWRAATVCRDTADRRRETHACKRRRLDPVTYLHHVRDVYPIWGSAFMVLPPHVGHEQRT